MTATPGPDETQSPPAEESMASDGYQGNSAEAMAEEYAEEYASQYAEEYPYDESFYEDLAESYGASTPSYEELIDDTPVEDEMDPFDEPIDDAYETASSESEEHWEETEEEIPDDEESSGGGGEDEPIEDEPIEDEGSEEESPSEDDEGSDPDSEQVAVDDPRFQWVPFKDVKDSFSDPIQVPDQLNGIPWWEVTPEGESPFETSTENSSQPISESIDPALGTGTRTFNTSVTAGHSQGFNDATDWTVSYSTTRSIHGDEQSADLDDNQLRFRQTGSETYSVVINSGRSATITYSLTDTFVFATGTIPDIDPVPDNENDVVDLDSLDEDSWTVPESWVVASRPPVDEDETSAEDENANEDTADEEEVPSDDEGAPQNQAGSRFQITATLTVVLVEELIIEADGSESIRKTATVTTSMGHTALAGMVFSSSFTEGELKPLIDTPPNIDSEGDSSGGEGYDTSNPAQSGAASRDPAPMNGAAGDLAPEGQAPFDWEPELDQLPLGGNGVSVDQSLSAKSYDTSSDAFGITVGVTIPMEDWLALLTAASEDSTGEEVEPGDEEIIPDDEGATSEEDQEPEPLPEWMDSLTYSVTLSQAIFSGGNSEHSLEIGSQVTEGDPFGGENEDPDGESNSEDEDTQIPWYEMSIGRFERPS